jgi:hypothetical protein
MSLPDKERRRTTVGGHSRMSTAVLRRRMRIRHRLAFLILPVLVLSLAVTWARLWANTHAFQLALGHALERLLPKGAIEYGDIRWSRLGHITLRGVVIRHPTTGKQLVAVKSIEAAVSGNPARILQGRLAITDIVVTEADVLLEFDDEGWLSLLDCFGVERTEEESEGDDLDLELSRIRVVRSKVLLSYPDLEIAANGVELSDGYFALPDGMTMKATASTTGGHVRIGAPGEGALRFDFNSISAKAFEWRRMAFSVGSVSAVVPDGTVELAGSVDLSVEPPSFKAAVQATGKGTMPAISLFTGDAIQGDFDVNADFHGNFETPSGSFRIHSVGTRAGDFKLGKVDILGEASGGELRLREGTAELLGGKVRLSGRVSIPDEEGEVTVGLDSIDIKPILKAAPEAIPWAGGKLTGTVSAKATGFTAKALAADAKVDLKLLRHASVTPVRLPAEVTVAGNVAYKGEVLRTRGLKLTVGPHTVDVVGKVDPAKSTLNVRVDATTGELAHVLAPLLPPNAGFGGRATLGATVAGLFDNPEIRGELSVAGLRALGKLSGERATAKFALVDGRLAVERLRAKTRVGEVDLRGGLVLWDGSVRSPVTDPPFEVAGVIRRVNLGMLAPPEARVKGSLDVEVDMKGTLAAPSGNAKLVSGSIQAYGESIDSITVDVGLTPEAVDVRDVKVQIDAQKSLAAKGRYWFDRRFKGDITAKQVPLKTIRTLAEAGVEIDGTVTIQLNGQGTIDRPRVRGMVMVNDLVLANRRLGNAGLRITTEDEGETIVVRAEKVFEHFSLVAKVGATGKQPEVDIRFHELPIAHFVPELAQFGATAIATGNAHVVFTPELQPVAALSLSELRIEHKGFRISNVDPGRSSPQPVVVGYQDGLVKLARVDLFEGGRPLSLRGSIDPKGPLNVRLAGEVGLSMVPAFAEPVVEAAGVLGVDLHVAGVIDNPVIKGSVIVKQPVGVQLRDLPGREILIQSGLVRIDRDRIFIPASSPFAGRFDEGTISVSGSVGLKDTALWDADIAVRARGVEWRHSPLGLSVTADADVRLEGHSLSDESQRSLVLSGQVDVQEGEVRKSFGITDNLFKPPSASTKDVDDKSILSALSFRELKVVGRDEFFAYIELATMEMQLELAPQLNIEGGIKRVVPQGAIEVLPSSFIKFQGRSFDEVRGAIEFNREGTPVLDLVAVGEVMPLPMEVDDADAAGIPRECINPEEALFVELGIKGPADKLVLEFASQSGLEDRDVIFLLFVGVTPECFNAQAGSGASGGAADVVLANFLEKIQQALQDGIGLTDAFKMLPQTAAKGVSLRLGGSALQGHLKAGVRAQLGADAQAVGAEVEVKITDHLRIETNVERRRNIDDDKIETPVEGKIRYRIPLD